MQSLEFEIPFVSLVFVIILCVIYLSKKKITLPENKYYEIILSFSFIEIIIDLVIHLICSLNTFEVIVSSYYNLFNFLNKILSTSFVIIFFSFFCYILMISYPKIRNRERELLKILGITSVSFLLITMFTTINLVKVGSVTNVSGTTIALGYIMVAIFLLATFLVTILNIKKLDKRYLAVFLILILMVVLYIVTLIFPGMIIYDLVLALLCYIMYFTIENPDIKMIEQLNLMKEQAEKANRAKSDFLSSMSHEIRTPLNAIVGFSECIKQSDSLEEAKENAEDVITASNTLLEIVNGILDISKIESGKLELVEVDYDTRKMLKEIERLIFVRIGDKPLEFKVDIAEDIPPVLYGDHSNVKKILINLLTNAVKYTDKGYVHFSLKCVKVNDIICRLIISVKDSGRGIKKENIDKLFTKFQRLDEDKNTTIEGTGLGLAITKQLVEMMNGKIVVNSIYGEGSEFTVAINQSFSKNILKKEQTTEITDFDLKDFKILVVDDNRLNLKVAQKLLNKYHPFVETCESGFECIDKIKEGKKYDLILMDDMMPKMRGVETLSKLKEDSSFSIPVIALTANAIHGMCEYYKKQGFDDYLSKPIDREELHRILQKYAFSKKVSIEKKQELFYSDYHDKKILIVDDNPLNLKIARKMLENYKFQIDQVTSGNECIEKEKHEHYDLIFMDSMMPNLSGEETLKILKEIPNFQAKVIVLTADALEGTREKYIQMGFDEYIAKPIDKILLNKVIHNILEKKNEDFKELV